MPNVNETGNDLNKEFLGRAIAGARVTAGYSQKDLCDVLTECAGIEIAASKMCRVEKGNQTPDINTLAAIAIVLGQHNWRRVLSGFIDAALSDTLRALSKEYERENEERETLTWLYSAIQTIFEEQTPERLNSLIDERTRRNHEQGNEVAEWLDEHVSERYDEPPEIVEGRKQLDALKADVFKQVVKCQVIREIAGKQATPAPDNGAVAIDETGERSKGNGEQGTRADRGEAS